MANNPNKLTDPADDTLTAIQQVLSVSDEPAARTAETPAEPKPQPQQRTAPTLQPTLPPPPSFEAEKTDSFSFGPTASGGRDSFEAERDVRSSQLPVSEERQSIGQIMRALEQRPSKTSYIIATVFAVVWAAIGVTLAIVYAPELQAL